ncbi:hypothetical protein FA10DRAFT_304734 [Acaromyces ingoldii]|uniref:Uncharacterized protein n=1 Tax=Acaromyces ingoldii TaxID=215250 RepID=A0A316YFI9_9BASI|nr:hypothetical protein FA10DRAFT_304734 [Acaromyces ingoldii]PWN86853.1 hypothetical protein FA10DRAFT_304734 [Acaromyces ingoldii]
MLRPTQVRTTTTMPHESAATRLRRLRLGDTKVPVLLGERTPPREFDSSTEGTLRLVNRHNDIRTPGAEGNEAYLCCTLSGRRRPDRAHVFPHSERLLEQLHIWSRLTGPFRGLPQHRARRRCAVDNLVFLTPNFHMYFGLEPGVDFTLTLTPSLATLIEVVISLETFLASKENDETFDVPTFEPWSVVASHCQHELENGTKRYQYLLWGFGSGEPPDDFFIRLGGRRREFEAKADTMVPTLFEDVDSKESLEPFWLAVHPIFTLLVAAHNAKSRDGRPRQWRPEAEPIAELAEYCLQLCEVDHLSGFRDLVRPPSLKHPLPMLEGQPDTRPRFVGVPWDGLEGVTMDVNDDDGNDSRAEVGPPPSSSTGSRSSKRARTDEGGSSSPSHRQSRRLQRQDPQDALSPFARPSDLGDETALTEPDEGDKGGADDDDDADVPDLTALVRKQKPTMDDFLVAIRAVEAYRERVAAVEVERDEAYARWLLKQAKEKGSRSQALRALRTSPPSFPDIEAKLSTVDANAQKLEDVVRHLEYCLSHHDG